MNTSHWGVGLLVSAGGSDEPGGLPILPIAAGIVALLGVLGGVIAFVILRRRRSRPDRRETPAKGPAGR